MPRPVMEFVLDGETVSAMASLGLTQNEVALALGCSHDTIYRRFGESFDAGKAKLSGSLRKKQVQLALAGNVTMLIWLGKNMLGQSDKLQATGADGSPLFPAVNREELIGKLIGPRDTAEPTTVQ
jgi:hypothetical protein